MKVAHIIPHKDSYRVSDVAVILGISERTVCRKLPEVSGYKDRIPKSRLKELCSELHPKWQIIFVDYMNVFCGYVLAANHSMNKNGKDPLIEIDIS